MHNFIIYAYHVLRISYKVRRYYYAIFRELTPIIS